MKVTTQSCFQFGVRVCLLVAVYTCIPEFAHAQLIPMSMTPDQVSGEIIGQGINVVPAQQNLVPCTSVQNADWNVSQGSCDSDCSSGILGFGLIQPSERGFDDFISPITNPVFFEDPRNLTEARAIFFQHKVPLAAGGGDVQLYAMQLRARLSENVSLIAVKDGYITSTNPLVQDGWADLGAGLKFNLLLDHQAGRLLSGGFTFELPTGESDPLQGNGDGELNLFMSGARRIGCRSQFMAASGLRVPMNRTDESMSSYFSSHVSTRVRPRLHLLAELNWFHWLQAGQDGAVPGVEGLDAFNFGSPGVAGNDIVTSAAGLKFKPNRSQEIGFAFEFPLTERRDIINNRLTVDWIFRY